MISGIEAAPSVVTITLTDGGQVSRSCREFGAYHGDTQLDNNHGRKRVAYAVIPRCRSQGSTLDTLTVSESHELMEAATDPRKLPAFAWPDDGAFGLPAFGEIGDLCELGPENAFRPPSLPYAVRRGWSNSRAAAGHDP